MLTEQEQEQKQLERRLEMLEEEQYDRSVSSNTRLGMFCSFIICAIIYSMNKHIGFDTMFIVFIVLGILLSLGFNILGTIITRK